jgi:DNA-binding transcriptional ArsR family regulator
MKEFEKQLKALANRRRLEIIKYLKRVGRATVTDIAREIKLSFRSTSRHLAVFRSAEILEREQVNLTMVYAFAKLSPVAKVVINLI